MLFIKSYILDSNTIKKQVIGRVYCGVVWYGGGRVVESLCVVCVCVCVVECMCVSQCALPQCSSVVYTVHKRNKPIYIYIYIHIYIYIYIQILDNQLFVFTNFHSFGKHIMTKQNGEWCVLVW